MNKFKTVASKSLAALLFIGISHAAGAGDLKSELVACPANNTAVGNVPSCGKIWKLKSGRAELRSLFEQDRR